MSFNKSIFFCSSHPSAPAYEFFTGTAIGAGFIILDEGGWREFENTRFNEMPSEGRFFVCRKLYDESRFKIETDSFGTEAIFVYQCPDHVDRWAISNSLQFLAESVSEFEWSLSVFEPAIASIFIQGSIGKQPFSSKTVYSEICLLSPAESVEIDMALNGFKIEKRVFNYQFSTYESALVNWFCYWRNVIGSLSKSRACDGSVMFDITGGIDSRMMMALALSLDDGDIEFFSTPHKLSDFEVASGLCDKFEVPLLDSSPNWHRLPSKDQYAWYSYGNCGYYTALTPAPLQNTPSYRVRVTGVGGENYRNFYQGSACQWLNKIHSLLPDSLSKFKGEVTRLLLNSIADLSIDPLSQDGMVDHYRKYRSRIIGGRSFYENLKFRYVSPLFDSYLLALSDNFSVKGKDLYRDILLLGGGVDLCSYKYDSQNKDFEVGHLKKSCFWKSDGAPYFDKKNPISLFDIYTDKKTSETTNVFNEDIRGGSLSSEIKMKVSCFMESDCFIRNADPHIRKFISEMYEGVDCGISRKAADYAIHSALIPYFTCYGNN